MADFEHAPQNVQEKIWRPHTAPPEAVSRAPDLAAPATAEQALLLSEERYRDLVENANDIIYTHDLAGQLTSWNRAGAQILGYTGEEIVGMNIAQIVVPEQLERARAMIARKVAEGGRTAYELDVLTKDDRRLTMEISSRIADQPGQPPHVQGMARDVTVRKRAEEALREADRKKDQFLALLAHELRNPLASLRYGLQVLNQQQDSPAPVRPVREMMERQVQQLTRLVDDLLDVARIARGKIDLRKEPLNLSAVVRNAVEMSHAFIEAAKHRLTIQLAPEPLTVAGDQARLVQVVTNLLNNAAKYTPEGGHIWLTVESHEDNAVVRVRDDGLGIPADRLSDIFEAFTQVEQSATHCRGGLGIGLTLVRDLVKLHDGSVVARSDGSGTGSEFVIRLPLHHPAPGVVIVGQDARQRQGMPSCFKEIRQVQAGIND